MSRAGALLVAILLVVGGLALPAGAQAYGPPISDATPLAPGVAPSAPNPASLIGDAASVLGGAAGTPGPREGGLSVALNIMILLTVIALAPSVMLMCTCFVRIIIVLGLLRQALGTQSIPPAQVITGLALFMTLLVMSPTIDRVWTEAIQPYQAGEIRDYDELWERAKRPMRDFMFDQIEATDNWSSVYTILNYRGVDTSEPQELTRADVDMITLVPAYMLSELKVGFMMGFRVYLPFLVIDMVIATILISMSMMMLPPVLISLPFKLLLFVLVDGWTLVVGSLLESFVQDGGGQRLSASAAALPLVLVVAWPRGRLRRRFRDDVRRVDGDHGPGDPDRGSQDRGADPAGRRRHRPGDQPRPIGHEHPGPDADLRAQDRRDDRGRGPAAPVDHDAAGRVRDRDAEAVLGDARAGGPPDPGGEPTPAGAAPGAARVSARAQGPATGGAGVGP